ncbi:MAG: hypothetical protein WCX71_01880 [Candidatus Buchananbacteria bacterium]
MLQKINYYFSVITLTVFGLLSAQTAQAGTFDQILSGFAKTGENAGYPVTDGGKPVNSFETTWANYINGMLTLMGILFMVNIIYAGFLWFNAHGKDEQVGRAKSMLINSTIGLAIIIFARLIVELVLFYLGQTVKTS